MKKSAKPENPEEHNRRARVESDVELRTRGGMPAECNRTVNANSGLGHGFLLLAIERCGERRCGV